MINEPIRKSLRRYVRLDCQVVRDFEFKPPRSNAWFDAQGIVARVVHGRRPGDYGLSYGIDFHGLSANDEQELFEHLRGMGRPDAQRPPRPLA